MRALSCHAAGAISAKTRWASAVEKAIRHADDALHMTSASTAISPPARLFQTFHKATLLATVFTRACRPTQTLRAR